MAKEGSTVSGLMDSFATAVSLALQYGVPLPALVDKFSHTRFDPQGFTRNPEIPIAKSVMDYIFRWLASRFLPQEERDRLGIRSFPSDNPATGILLALATFGVGYVARPVRGFVLGHVGDKFGRRTVLIFTLIFMGASTFLVGCLPPYSEIGVWAPILLVILRLAQGFSASGEQAGANSLTLEHAPPHRRAYYTSFTLSV